MQCPNISSRRTREPIDLIHDDHIDLITLDVFQQSLQPRSLDIPPREAAVIIVFANECPALVRVALGKLQQLVVGQIT